MYQLDYTNQFRKDLKRVSKQGLDISLLLEVLRQLECRGQVDAKYRPHVLTGNWAGFWECHIAADWLLIYDIADSIKVVRLTRTGSHSEILSKRKR